jgi:hypothetical protein
VNDNITIIHKDPSAILPPLAGAGFDTLLLQFFFNIIRDGRAAALGRRATDHKIIAEIGRLAHIKDNNILGLLLDGQLSGLDRSFLSVG